MAERRMFTTKITDSDAFTALPPTTQALYFHLCMNADDDGFNNKIRQAMFNAHADQNDFNLLVQYRFIIPFDNKGIIVIKHWRLHNIIRSDRYHETEYVEEKARLILKDNGVYTDSKTPIGIPSDNQVATKRQPNDNQMETEVSIGKVSIGNNIYSANFETFWSAYPRKKEKQRAYKCFNARIKDGFSEVELTQAAKKYAEECLKEHREDKYIKLPATFLSANTPFMDYLGEQKSTPVNGPLDYEIDNSDTHPQIPPYYGFPKEWFDGTAPVRERFKPLKQVHNYSIGITDDIVYSADELWEKYNLRKAAYENGYE
jgi:hypothetical protein